MHEGKKKKKKKKRDTNISFPFPSLAQVYFMEKNPNDKKRLLLSIGPGALPKPNFLSFLLQGGGFRLDWHKHIGLNKALQEDMGEKKRTYG